jgi:xylan 1,4-beta-xylosidase
MIRNPVIRGFAPDPSAVRAGDYYYIANSTFEWFPGVRLHRSRDLETWTEVRPPLRRATQLDMRGDPNSGGVWAPDISAKDGVFYLVYTDVKSKHATWYNTPNYVVWTDDIEGDWSDPVYLNSSGFDPALFHDDDGRTWLVNMKNGFGGILLQEFSVEEKKLVGEIRNVYPGSGAGYTEGPHIYKRNGMYYLLVAEGGTGLMHRVTVARSESLFGPYETMPSGPLVTSCDDATLSLQKAGHGDLFEAANGDWYVCFLCSRPVAGNLKSVLGRETAIEKIVWRDDGWPELARGGHNPGPATADARHDYRDDFDSRELDFGWKSLRFPLGADASLSVRKGFLALAGRESIYSNHRVTLLARKQESLVATTSAALEFESECAEQIAGIAYMYDNMHFYLLAKSKRSDGKATLSLYEYNALKPIKTCEEEIPEGRIELSVRTDSVRAQFSYRMCGVTAGVAASACSSAGSSIDGWKAIGPALDVAPLSDEEARGFTGAHFALYCHDLTGRGKQAFFDYFSALSV